MTEPLPWANSTLLGGNDDVARLKEDPGQNLVIFDSGDLGRGFGDLVDEYTR